MNTSNDCLMRDLARVYLLLHRKVDRAMSEQGASLARTKLLLCVETAEGRVRATDIAELFGQAPRTVTEALDAAERDGLIERTPDPDDRRVKRVAITEAGRQAIAATEPLRLRLVGELFDRLDDAERGQLHATLGKLAETLPQL